MKTDQVGRTASAVHKAYRQASLLLERPVRGRDFSVSDAQVLAFLGRRGPVSVGEPRPRADPSESGSAGPTDRGPRSSGRGAPAPRLPAHLGGGVPALSDAEDAPSRPEWRRVL